MRSRLPSLEYGPTVDSGGSIKPARELGDPRDDSSERSAIRPVVNESASSLRRASAIDEQEHVADVLRLRMVLSGALVLWALTGVLDWSVVHFVEPGSLSYFLFLRGGAMTVMLIALSRLFVRPPPSASAFRLMDMGIFTTAALAASLMCLHYRGISSPYAHALSCILVVRGIALPYHYRRGIPAVLGPTVAFPIVMGLAALYLPNVREQFRQPAELAIFLQNAVLIGVTGLMTVLGGHSMWTLRRQVFAARNIGRYRLQARIGQGGMGEVWQAYHPSLRRAVAIKLLRSHETSPHALARFEREVRATSELKHPNTIRVFDFGITEDGLWYYAMELLEGETLADLVDREGPLPTERAIKLLRQACRALAEAHGRGIVHRDIKPENLFVTALGGESDFIKVLDFGIAKLLGDELLDTANRTKEGAVLGTPAFMSPEQFEGHTVDARTDVFSLGAVLYFMLAGQAPYSGTTLAAIRAAHFMPVKTPSEIIQRPVPELLEDVIMRCLEREPTKRYRSAAELDEALTIATAEDKPAESGTYPASARSAQSGQSAQDELARDPLAEHATEVRIVDRMSEPSSESGGLLNPLAIKGMTDEP